MVVRRRGAAPGPPQVEPGTQPEVAGKLPCLICGRAFGQLGQHVVAKHQVSDDYRARFGLPAGRGLHSSRIRQARAELGRRRWRQDPQLRQRLQPTRTTAAQRAESAAAARRATLSGTGRRCGFVASRRPWRYRR
jgi:hypothetical protein